jgi:uncharacterized membrane protein (Fun14 family)
LIYYTQENNKGEKHTMKTIALILVIIGILAFSAAWIADFILTNFSKKISKKA